MSIDFNDKVLVTNPTAHFLGRSVATIGAIEILTGAITHFAGDFLLPSPAWIALGVPTVVIGVIVSASALRKN